MIRSSMQELWISRGRILFGGMLSVCLAMMVVSCSNDRVVFAEEEKIGGQGWTYGDSIRFAFTAPDTSNPYDLLLTVSHSEEYSWENLYVKILTSFPGDSVKSDVLSLELANHTGLWQGRCAGRECELEIPLQVGIRFPFPGDYALTFIQHMRQEVVPGISGFHLEVRKSE